MLIDEAPVPSRSSSTVIVLSLVVRSMRSDDAPAEAFSLAGAAANAADAKLVDYDVTILVGDEVITTASGMIDVRTGSTYLRVSSSIGETSDATDLAGLDDSSTSTAVSAGASTSVGGTDAATPGAVATTAGPGTAVVAADAAAAATTTAVVAATTTAATATTDAATDDTGLDAPSVPEETAKLLLDL